MAKKSILGEFMNNDIKKLSFNNDIENIHYTKIKPAAKNRELRRIDELAADIADAGLENSITVRKIEDPEYDYELVAGERRYTAICVNIEQGDLSYEYIPSKVVTLDDLDARKRLILNNYQNDPLTPAEKIDAVKELKEIYRLKKVAGEKISGRLQQIIANELGMKKSQIGNYEKVINNAVPEVRELIKKGDITVSAAAELSSLTEDDQLMFVENNMNFDIKTVKEYKEEINSGKKPVESDSSKDLISQACDKSEIKTNGSLYSRLDSVEDCIIGIENLYNCLEEKVKGTEWSAELLHLQLAIESFNTLKTILDI